MPNKINSALSSRRNQENSIDNDFNSLFGIENNNSGKKIVDLPIEMLIEYENKEFLKLYGQPQPFREYLQNELELFAEKIALRGVLEPIIVRPYEDKYQIIAGRHRVRACILKGIAKVPSIIRSDVDDDKAALIMIDTNLDRRQNLLPSEKAHAYKLQMEITNRQGHRSDLGEALCNDCTKIDSLSEAGKKNNDSRRTVAYYVRLSSLLPELLNLVDNDKLPLIAGVNISYISPEEQKIVFNWLKDKIIKMSVKQSELIKEASGNNEITYESLQQLFCSNQKPKVSKTISIQRKKLKGYEDIIPDDESEIETLFIGFLEWLRGRSD